MVYVELEFNIPPFESPEDWARYKATVSKLQKAFDALEKDREFRSLGKSGKEEEALLYGYKKLHPLAEIIAALRRKSDKYVKESDPHSYTDVPNPYMDNQYNDISGRWLQNKVADALDEALERDHLGASSNTPNVNVEVHIPQDMRRGMRRY